MEVYAPNTLIPEATLSKTSVVAGLLALALVGIFAFLGIYLQQPPARVAASAAATEFSSDRAMKHVETIAQSPRPIGSAKHAEARDYILKELNALGLAAEVQKTTVVNQKWGPPFLAGTVENIVARQKGTGDGRALMLVAHYDSVTTGAGANDDGTGVATLLETARALKAANQTLKNDVIFLFTDGEETGLLGARAFVDEHAWAKDVKLALNFEARGTGGSAIMFETSPQNGALIREFAKSASNPVANSLSYEIYKRMPNDTDMSVFKEAGLQGLNFAYIDGLTHYHSELDTVANVEAGSLQHQGSYALSLARHFGNVNLGEAREGDAIYFNALGSLLVHYPAGLALPLALFVLLLFAAVLVLGFRRKQLTVRGLIKSGLLFLASLIAAPLVVTGAWWLIRTVHGSYGSIPQGDTYNRGFYVLGFVALTIAVASILLVLFGRKTSVPNLVAGALLWWAVLMVASSLLMPGASYLLTWPLLFALIGLGYTFIAGDEQTGAAKRLIVFSLCAAPGLLLVLPLLNFTFMAMPLAMAGMLVVLLVLLLALLIPHLRYLTARRRWALPVAAAAVGVAFFVVAGLSSGFDKNHRQSNHVLYGFNADTQQAIWASADARPDAWTTQFFATRAERGPLADYFPLSRRPYLKAQAAAGATPLAAPDVKVLDDVTENGVRRLRLHIASPREASMLSVQAEQNSELLNASVNGKRVTAANAPASPAGSNRWGFYYFALPKDGIELTLETKTAQPLTLKVVDETYGLPNLTGISLKSRPDHMMPAPMPFSDSTLVSKSYTF